MQAPEVTNKIIAKCLGTSEKESALKQLGWSSRVIDRLMRGLESVAITLRRIATEWHSGIDDRMWQKDELVALLDSIHASVIGVASVISDHLGAKDEIKDATQFILEEAKNTDSTIPFVRKDPIPLKPATPFEQFDVNLIGKQLAFIASARNCIQDTLKDHCDKVPVLQLQIRMTDNTGKEDVVVEGLDLASMVNAALVATKGEEETPAPAGEGTSDA